MNPQQMKQAAFEARMKKQLFPKESVFFIKQSFEHVLLNYSIGSLKTSTQSLLDVMNKTTDINYLDAGLMINAIIGAPFEKLGVLEARSIQNFLTTLAPIVKDYEDFAMKCDKDAERETKTKLEIIK
jgi:hypothetical protein